MTELEHYVVEAADETYHHTPDDGENAHRIGLPIIAGPFDTREQAEQEANAPAHYHQGRMAVTIPEGEVPDDWKDE